MHVSSKEGGDLKIKLEKGTYNSFAQITKEVSRTKIRIVEWILEVYANDFKEK